MPDTNSHATSILAEALKRTDPAARTGYLDGACGDDTDLRGRVEALLAAHDGAGRLPEHAPTTLPEATSSPDVDATGTGSPEMRPSSGQTTGAHPPGGTRTVAEDTRPGGPPDGSSLDQVIAGRYRLTGVLGEGGWGPSIGPSRPSRSAVRWR
jgi:hypothetical protein